MTSLSPRPRFLATQCPIFRNQVSLTRTIFTAIFAGPIFFRVSLNVTRVFPYLLPASLGVFCRLEMVLSSVPHVMWKAGHANVEICNQFSVDLSATCWELEIGRSRQFNVLTMTTLMRTVTYPKSHCECVHYAYYVSCAHPKQSTAF